MRTEAKNFSENPGIRAAIRGAVQAALENGWSLNAIAKEADVPQPVLYRFIQGQREDLRAETAEKLLAHFGMRVTAPSRNVGRVSP